MSRRSDNGRSKWAWDIDCHGRQRTPCEKRRADKAIKAKQAQKAARKRNWVK